MVQVKSEEWGGEFVVISDKCHQCDHGKPESNSCDNFLNFLIWALFEVLTSCFFCTSSWSICFDKGSILDRNSGRLWYCERVTEDVKLWLRHLITELQERAGTESCQDCRRFPAIWTSTWPLLLWCVYLEEGDEELDCDSCDSCYHWKCIARASQMYSFQSVERVNTSIMHTHIIIYDWHVYTSLTNRSSKFKTSTPYSLNPPPTLTHTHTHTHTL